MNKLNFHTLLGRYFDGGWFNRRDGLLSILFHAFIFKMNARKLINAFHHVKLPPAIDHFQTIVIPAYEGNNPGVIRMIEALKPLHSDLFAAIVHGSIATSEEIPYSDFDGLLIVRDEVFEDRNRLVKLAHAIHATKSIMYQIDPLQHHGWFVLTERDLSSYPLTFLPPEVLHYSKSLLPLAESVISIKLRSSHDFYTPVKRLCRKIRKMKSDSHRPKSMYQLKSLLSEFMLLPALYIQARDQRGIFKKFSFTAAAVDFTQSSWDIMEEVSRIRAEWPAFHTEMQDGKFKKIGYIWNQYRKRMGPAIPALLKKRLNDDFYNRMAELANQVEVNLFR